MEKELKLKSYYCRIYPDLGQRQLIVQTFGNCRWYWNWLLSATVSYKKQNGSYEGLVYKTEKELKKEFDWLKLGSSRALVAVKGQLTNAFKNIRKSGSNFPKFKKKNAADSYTEQQIVYPKQPPAIEIKDSKIKLLKLGWVRFRNGKQEIKGEIRKATVIRVSNGDYFVSILTRQEIDKKSKVTQVVGIDFGVKTFAVLSNGESVQSPKFFQTAERKISRTRRRLSRKKLGSSNYHKQRLRLACLCEKVKNKRTNFLHQVSNKIINESQVIFLEDLNIKGIIKNRSFGKKVSDAAWYTFTKQLGYKADWYGRTLVKIPRFFPSSKTCSACGQVKEDLTMRDRVYQCLFCGSEIDRDLNAAINIRDQGLFILKQKNTEEYSEINACGEGKITELNRSVAFDETRTSRSGCDKAVPVNLDAMSGDLTSQPVFTGKELQLTNN